MYEERSKVEFAFKLFTFMVTCHGDTAYYYQKAPCPQVIEVLDVCDLLLMQLLIHIH